MIGTSSDSDSCDALLSHKMEVLTRCASQWRSPESRWRSLYQVPKMSYGLFITRHCKLKPAEENVRHYQSLGHLLHTLSVIVTLVYSVPFIILLSMAALSHSLPLPDHPVKATVLRDILYKYNIAYLITCTICQLSDPLKPEISLKGKGKGLPRTGHKGPEGE